MNSVATTFLVAAAGLALVNWWAVSTGRSRLEWITKPAVMILLIGVAISLDVATPAVRIWFLVALLFSLAGDVFLMLPKERFVEGLASFLVAHVAYIVGLTTADLDWSGVLLGISAALLGIAVVGGRIQRAAAQSDRGLGVPVGAYIVVISGMLAAAIAATNITAIIGAAFFYASDAILGWNRFVAPLRGGRVLTMVTYHTAQALLVLSLVSL